MESNDDVDVTLRIRLYVRGDHACFSRPEFARDRISYDIITPAAARGILESIHAADDMRWQVDAIHLLRPILFRDVNIAALAVPEGGDVPSEGGARASERVVPIARAQVLVDVAYVVVAQPVPVAKGAAAAAESAAQVLARLRDTRSARAFLGMPAFRAEVALIEDDAAAPASSFPAGRPADFGWMLHDCDPADPTVPRFYRAIARNGVVRVPPPGSADLAL